jgi:hypothetical protein
LHVGPPQCFREWGDISPVDLNSEMLGWDDSLAFLRALSGPFMQYLSICKLGTSNGTVLLKAEGLYGG